MPFAHRIPAYKQIKIDSRSRAEDLLVKPCKSGGHPSTIGVFFEQPDYLVEELLQAKDTVIGNPCLRQKHCLSQQKVSDNEGEDKKVYNDTCTAA